jgi:hypothetical protein
MFRARSATVRGAAYASDVQRHIVDVAGLLWGLAGLRGGGVPEGVP